MEKFQERVKEPGTSNTKHTSVDGWWGVISKNNVAINFIPHTVCDIFGQIPIWYYFNRKPKIKAKKKRKNVFYTKTPISIWMWLWGYWEQKAIICSQGLAPVLLSQWGSNETQAPRSPGAPLWKRLRRISTHCLKAPPSITGSLPLSFSFFHPLVSPCFFLSFSFSLSHALSISSPLSLPPSLSFSLSTPFFLYFHQTRLWASMEGDNRSQSSSPDESIPVLQCSTVTLRRDRRMQRWFAQKDQHYTC